MAFTLPSSQSPHPTNHEVLSNPPCLSTFPINTLVQATFASAMDPGSSLLSGFPASALALPPSVRFYMATMVIFF